MSLTRADPYAILGIPRDASYQQVRRAYRRLAKRYHPDLHPDAQTSQEMGRVNRAWETLSSPGSRARYDAESALPKSTSFGHWSAPARRPADAPSQRQTWNTASASPSAARTYPRYAAGQTDAGTGWVGITGAVAVGLLLVVAIFSGIVPAPLFGIVLIIAARSLFARFD